MGQERLGPSYFLSARSSKQPRMVRTILKVYMERGSYFLFLREQIKDTIITILLLYIISARPSKQPLMVRTFLKVYMELGSYFLFLSDQNK